MRRRTFALHPAAQVDLVDTWGLIVNRDGPDRADAVYARIEAFCRSLGEFSDLGTRHDQHRPGLRSVGIPSVPRATVLFVTTSDTVTVLRIGYLGRNIWQDIPA